MPRDHQYVADILAACERVRAYIDGLNQAQFEDTPLVQDAVIRQIMVIGEATKRLSPAFTGARGDAPWANVAGMRDVLIHGYDGIDLGEVWRGGQAVLGRKFPKCENASAPVR